MNEENYEIEVNDEVEDFEVDNDDSGLSTGAAVLLGSLATAAVAVGVSKFKKWREKKKMEKMLDDFDDNIEDEIEEVTISDEETGK